MKTILKYPLAIQDSQLVAIPVDSHVAFVGNQNGTLTLWMHVNIPDATVPDGVRPPLHDFRVYVRGTGTRSPADATYCGSAIIPPFVWHVWIAS